MRHHSSAVCDRTTLWSHAEVTCGRSSGIFRLKKTQMMRKVQINSLQQLCVYDMYMTFFDNFDNTHTHTGTGDDGAFLKSNFSYEMSANHWGKLHLPFNIVLSMQYIFNKLLIIHSVIILTFSWRWLPVIRVSFISFQSLLPLLFSDFFFSVFGSN